jgi:hypothetical protein
MIASDNALGRLAKHWWLVLIDVQAYTWSFCIASWKSVF